MPALLARYGVASVGLALVEDGRVVLERAYGQQSAGVPRHARHPLRPRLGDQARLRRGAAAPRLAATGRLSHDEPVAAAWVDPDVAGDPRHRRLTPRIALAHQTGFPNWRDRAPGRGLAFAFAPGAGFGYSGEGYDYAARFAEHKLGRSFEALAEEAVFGPLGMRSTAYSRRGWMRGRLAVGLDSAGRWGERTVAYFDLPRVRRLTPPAFSLGSAPRECGRLPSRAAARPAAASNVSRNRAGPGPGRGVR